MVLSANALDVRSSMMKNIHGAAKQLDLHCHDCLSKPDCREDTAEDKRSLVLSCVDTQEEGE